MKKLLKAYLLLSFIFVPFVLHAVKYGNLHTLEWGEDTEFLFPNEEQPERLEDFLKKAPRGLWVGVGTVRNLFALSMYGVEKFNEAIVVDSNPNVINFTGYLLFLIEISNSRSEFLSNVKSKSVTFDKLKKYFYGKHFNKVNCANFNRVLALELKCLDFKKETEFLLEGKSGEFKPFGRTFFSDDRLFNRLKGFVDIGLISFVLIDLSKKNQRVDLARQIEKHNDIISVLDLSNCQDGYLEFPGISDVLRDLSSVMHKDAILLLTAFEIECAFQATSKRWHDHKAHYLLIKRSDYNAIELQIMVFYDKFNPTIKITTTVSQTLERICNAVVEMLQSGKSEANLLKLWTVWYESLAFNTIHINRSPKISALAWTHYLKSKINEAQIDIKAAPANWFLGALNNDISQIVSLLGDGKTTFYKMILDLDEKTRANYVSNGLIMAVMANERDLVLHFLSDSAVNGIADALLMAAEMGNWEMVEWILEHESKFAGNLYFKERREETLSELREMVRENRVDRPQLNMLLGIWRLVGDRGNYNGTIDSVLRPVIEVLPQVRTNIRSRCLIQ